MNKKEFEKKLEELLAEASKENELHQLHMNSLVHAGLEFNIAAFEKTFHTCILKFGFEFTIEKILYPLLKKAGILWQREKMHPAQEHFISNLVRQKLFTAIDGLPPPQISEKKFLLFLPEFDDHEIGLLYSNYLISKASIPVIYLGPRVPVESLSEAVKKLVPTHLLLFITTRLPSKSIKKYLTDLVKAFPKQELLLSGSHDLIHQKSFPKEIKLLNQPSDLSDFLK